jgi:DNA polymerase-3 subunit alpha
LDDFKLEINNFTKNTLSDLQDLNSLFNKQVSVAGLVTEVKHLTTKTGRPFGSFTVEDYSDSHRFVLFGKDYETYRNYLFEGYSLLIKGTVQENPWKKDFRELEFKIHSLTLLANVRDEVVKGISLRMPLSEVSETSVERILEQAEKSKGNAHLSFKIYDEEERMELEMFSRSVLVQVSNEFVDYLEKNNIDYALS